MIGLFCKRALQKRRYSAKETYNFKEPTNPIHFKDLHVAIIELDRRECVCVCVPLFFFVRGLVFVGVWRCVDSIVHMKLQRCNSS